MIRFDINLSTRPYFDQKLVSAVLWSLLLLFMLISAWSGFMTLKRYSELKKVRASIADASGRLNAKPAGVAEKDYSRLMASIKTYNAIIDKKSYPWLELLESLEMVVPDGVAVSMFSPDLKTGEVKIDAKTLGFDRIQRFVDQLESSGRFGNVLLQSHRPVYHGEGADGYDFSITCRMATP